MTSLLGRMQTIADKLQKENWVLDTSGDQAAVKQQYVSLLSRNSESLQQGLHLRVDGGAQQPATEAADHGRPKYVSLAAASAPTSPIKSLYELVRDETALTREHSKPAPNPAGEQGKQDLKQAGANALNQLGTASREAIDLAIKSQRKAGEPLPEVPGATVENAFKPYSILVDGAPGSRPVDALVANFSTNSIKSSFSPRETRGSETGPAADRGSGGES